MSSRRNGRDPEVLWGSVGLFLVLVSLGVLLLAPGLLDLLPRCLLKGATGWPCPTCGLTRMGQALAAGRFLEAAACNPLAAGGLLFGGLYLPYAGLVVAGILRPIRTGWLSAPMPLWVRAGALSALAGNWLWLVVSGR